MKACDRLGNKDRNGYKQGTTGFNARAASHLNIDIHRNTRKQVRVKMLII